MFFCAYLFNFATLATIIEFINYVVNHEFNVTDGRQQFSH